jgi:hypothetical protein
MFEDYGNGVLDDGNLVEAVDIIRNSKEMVNAERKTVSKKSYKSIKDKEQKKLAKKAYKADLEYNEEIEIAKFVCDELNKFDTKAHTYSYNTSKEIYENGLSGLLEMNLDTINEEIAKAKALPRSNADEKELRKIAIEIAKNKKTAFKTIQKYFKDTDFVMPKYSDLQKLYDEKRGCKRVFIITCSSSPYLSVRYLTGEGILFPILPVSYRDGIKVSHDHKLVYVLRAFPTCGHVRSVLKLSPGKIIRVALKSFKLQRRIYFTFKSEREAHFIYGFRKFLFISVCCEIL